ncbi:hypothetical protein U9M48_012074 [Paspalum notatum var. saurae]|uniref:Phytoene synthase n=1 Tax=Paspalum notatum var. saurae TaxID=547442 RepID=A0AAQ3SYA2_PASNO
MVVEAAAVAKLLVAEASARRQATAGAPGEHWAFLYAMLRRVSRGFALVIQQLAPAELRNAVCVFYLVLRALDTLEAAAVYVISWQKDTVKMRGARKFISFHMCSQILNPLLICTFIVTGVQKMTQVSMQRSRYRFFRNSTAISTTVIGISHIPKGYRRNNKENGYRDGDICMQAEDLAPDPLSSSTGSFLQKINIIQDYLDDINEIPKPRMFWPREIWIKYIETFEDFKYEKNSRKAVQCLNEMVSNGLTHVEDCLRYMSSLKDLSVFRFCAIPQVLGIAMYAHCYSNVDIFRGIVKLRHGLVARVTDETNSMADVFTAFYEFCLLLESKINNNDPNAMLTRKRVNAIKEICNSSGLLKQNRGYYLDKPKCNVAMVCYFYR